MNPTLSDFDPAVQRRILTKNPGALSRRDKGAKLAAANMPQDRYKSKLERDYAECLGFDPDVRAWFYEPAKLLIAGGKHTARFTCDFLVQYSDGRIEWHEVKGRWMEAARVRIKVAASTYPFWKFRAVTRENGSWIYEDF